MLKGIIIRNFQTHKKCKIKFGQAVNTIIGPTDKGKSAVIRALRWALRNEPNGKDFINWDADSAKVSIKCDRSIITRERGRENTYHMDGEEYKAFGNTVPDAIQDHLKLSHVNFQSQLDPPFWFGLSPSETSRQLNQIINLGVIDEVMSEVASEVRTAQSTVRLVEERVSEAKASLKELSHLKQMDEDLKGVEELHTEYCDARNEATGLAALLTSTQAHAKTVKRSRFKAKQLGSVLLLAKEYRDNSKQYHALLEVVQLIEEAQESIREVPDFNPVQVAWEARFCAIENHDDMEDLVTRICETKETIKEKTELYKEREHKFHKQTKGVKCPLCQKPM